MVNNDYGKIWIKLSDELFQFSEDVYLCYVYIPPTGSKVLKDKDFDFYEEIEKDLEKYSKMGKTYITGDFNARTATLPDILDFDAYLDPENDTQGEFDINSLPIRKNQDTTADSNGQKLISLCKSTCNIIANGRLFNDTQGHFTFSSMRGLSVTYYLLLNIFDLDSIHDFNILNWTTFSDHAGLHFTFLGKDLNNDPENDCIETDLFYQRLVFNEDMVPNYRQKLEQNLQTFDINFCASTNISNKVDLLTNFLHENAMVAFGKTIPKHYKSKNCKNNTKTPKWFTDNCYNAKRDFINARNIFNKNKSTENRSNVVKMRTKYNRIRQKAKYNHKKNEGQRLENIAKTQPKKFWKSVKKCYTKSKSSNEDITLEKLHDHFKTLLGDIPDTNNLNEEEFPGPKNDELDAMITEQEIRKAVFKQKNDKSSGPDDISAEIIKSSYDIISPYIISIFNYLFNNSEYPESWGLGYIVPIFKGGDEKQAKNYCGITLNNILAKIYSQVLLNRLTEWTEKYSKISNCQFDYQKGKSTTDCIFILNSVVSKVLNSGQKLYAVFIDYEKCFDKIDHIFL